MNGKSRTSELRCTQELSKTLQRACTDSLVRRRSRCHTERVVSMAVMWCLMRRVRAAQDLLLEVQAAGGGSVDHLALASVLVNAAKGEADDSIRATALRWLATFVADAKPALLPLYAAILQAILPALSSQQPDILKASSACRILMFASLSLPCNG